MRDQLSNFTTTAAATLAENIETANERALEAVVDANRRFVEFAVTTADRVAEQISFELPFADRLPTLPTPAESGERYLDFVERAVAINREFNDRIVAALKSDTVTVDTLVAKVNARTEPARTAGASRAAAATATAKTAAKKTTATAKTAAKKTTATAKTAAKKTTATAKKTAAKAPAAAK